MSNSAAFAPLTVPVLAETEHEHAAMTAARSRGYAAGFAEGRRAAALEQEQWLALAEAERAAEAAAAAERFAVLTNALRAAAIELREATVPVLEEAHETLVDAAFALAGAAVGDALADRLGAARAAVSRVVGADLTPAAAVVRLNPADLALLRAKDELPETPRLVADESLAPGDAVGELAGGWLDARIHSALDRAKEALR